MILLAYSSCTGLQLRVIGNRGGNGGFQRQFSKRRLSGLRMLCNFDTLDDITTVSFKGSVPGTAGTSCARVMGIDSISIVEM